MVLYQVDFFLERLLEEQKNRKLTRHQATIHLKRYIYGHLVSSALGRETVDGAKACNRTGSKPIEIEEGRCAFYAIERAQYSVLRFLGGRTFAGMRCHHSSRN